MFGNNGGMNMFGGNNNNNNINLGGGGGGGFGQNFNRQTNQAPPQLSMPLLGSNLEERLRRKPDVTSTTNRRVGQNKPGDYRQLGTRIEPTSNDFEQLLRSSDQLLNASDLPVTTLKRSLIDTGLASKKFELEQRTRSFLDQTVNNGGNGGGINTSRSVEQNHNRAKKLLSAHGINVEQHQQAHDLINFRTRGTFSEEQKFNSLGKYFNQAKRERAITYMEKHCRLTFLLLLPPPNLFHCFCHGLLYLKHPNK